MRIAPLLLLAACASPGVPSTQVTPGRETSIISTGTGAQVNVAVEKMAMGGALPVPVAKAWAALPATYAALGIAVEYADDRSRTIGNTRLTVRNKLGDARLSTYLRCGQGMTGPIADTHRVRMNIRTQVTGSSDSTMVATLIEAVASSVEGASGSNIECTSAGTLEQAIKKRLTWEVLNARG